MSMYARATASKFESGQFTSDEDLEKLALAAAETIKLLAAERRSLYAQNSSLERELARAMAQLALIRDTYRKLAAEFLNQLQRVEEVIGEATKQQTGTANQGPEQEEPEPQAAEEPAPTPAPLAVHSGSPAQAHTNGPDGSGEGYGRAALFDLGRAADREVPAGPDPPRPAYQSFG
jgi:hypothetical protein